MSRGKVLEGKYKNNIIMSGMFSDNKIYVQVYSKKQSCLQKP